MKKTLTLLFLSFYTLGHSQQSILKKFESLSENIEIYTLGIDNLVIKKSNSDFIKIYLVSEDSNNIGVLTEEKKDILEIKFTLKFLEREDGVFRKFITKRLNRASVIISIPEQKNISVFGENVDVESKSYEGDLSVFIEKGSVKFNTVKGNVLLKLFSGNIYASLLQNTNVEVVTNKGKVKINDKSQTSPFYLKPHNVITEFNVSSINANVWLINKK